MPDQPQGVPTVNWSIWLDPNNPKLLDAQKQQAKAVWAYVAELDSRLTPPQRKQIQDYNTTLEARVRQDVEPGHWAGGGNPLDEWNIWDAQTDGFHLFMFYEAWKATNPYDFLPWSVWADPGIDVIYGSGTPYYIYQFQSLYEIVTKQAPYQTPMSQTGGTVMPTDWKGWSTDAGVVAAGTALWNSMTTAQRSAFQTKETTWFATLLGASDSTGGYVADLNSWKSLNPGVRLVLYEKAATDAANAKQFLVPLITVWGQAYWPTLVTPYLSSMQQIYAQAASAAGVTAQQTTGAVTVGAGASRSGLGILLLVIGGALALGEGKK